MISYEDIKKIQIDSFFNYVKIPSQNKGGSDSIPSSEGQMKLAGILAYDLKTLGLKNIVLNDNAIVTALLPKNKDNVHSVGFVAHIDTVDIWLNGNINPQILNFKGDDFYLNKEENIIFKVSEHNEINNYIREDIIFLDGTSVLGADNKAAIATIMPALKYII